MLRQWDRLVASSKKGLQAVLVNATASSSNSKQSSSTVVANVSAFESTFREHRKHAKAELAIKSVLTEAGIVESRHAGQLQHH
jgi:hypothetical protein